MAAPPPPISDPSVNESGRIVAAVAITTSLALTAVVSRVAVRTLLIRAFGWDDALMVLAMATSVVGFALIVIQAQNGAGRHRGDVPPDTYLYGMKINFINQPIYLFAICFVKLAVGTALMRIAVIGSRYKRIIACVMGFMLFYTIACFFTIVFQCSNIRAIYNPAIPAKCFNITTLKGLGYTNASCNILTDLAFSLFIPVPMLWKLNMNKRKKASLIGVLALGVFATVAACVKVSYLINYGKKGDFLWDSRNISIWTAAELNAGIIAGSLPPLTPLFKTVLGSTLIRASGYAGNSAARRYPRMSESGPDRSGSKQIEKRPDQFGDVGNQTAHRSSDLKMDSSMQSKTSVSTHIRSHDPRGHRSSSATSDQSALVVENSIARTTVVSVEYS